MELLDRAVRAVRWARRALADSTALTALPASAENVAREVSRANQVSLERPVSVESAARLARAENRASLVFPVRPGIEESEG
jgi:hypothetical protein